LPVVGIATATLKRLIGKSLSREELVAALEQLGNNVEGPRASPPIAARSAGSWTEVLDHADFNNVCEWCGSKALVETGSSEVIRISLLPVRPDMFDAAGLARALRGYLGIETGLPVLSRGAFRAQGHSAAGAREHQALHRRLCGARPSDERRDRGRR